MNRKKWIYWSLKIMFAVVLGGSALAKLARSEQLTQTFNHLGYPSYLLNILGIGYLLGLVGLFQSKVPILREWAYAGFAIALVGAFSSHLLAGDPIVKAVPALVLLVIMFGAYFLEDKAKH